MRLADGARGNAAELSVLAAQPADVIRADLASFGVTARLRSLYDDPARGLAELAAQIEAYREIAIAEDWPRIQVVLEGDILGRARQSAEHGTAAILNSLHERVRWEDGALTVRQQHCTAENLSDGGGLTLVPSVFVWPTVLTVSTGAMPQIAYPARGLATLWENRPQLAAIVGRNRARLLIEMATPVSTTELARRTGITAGECRGISRCAGRILARTSSGSVLCGNLSQTPTRSSYVDVRRLGRFTDRTSRQGALVDTLTLCY